MPDLVTGAHDPQGAQHRTRAGVLSALRGHLRDTDDAFDALTDTAAEPSGQLRLTAALDDSVRVVVPTTAAFTWHYPACKVDAIFSAQTLDLMTSNIKLALRVGWLAESSLQPRKIGAFRQLLLAPSTMTAHLTRVTAPQDSAALSLHRQYRLARSSALAIRARHAGTAEC
ncbi:hypothetical protein ACFQS6_01195 [Xanthomonas populi]